MTTSVRPEPTAKQFQETIDLLERNRTVHERLFDKQRATIKDLRAELRTQQGFNEKQAGIIAGLSTARTEQLRIASNLHLNKEDLNTEILGLEKALREKTDRMENQSLTIRDQRRVINTHLLTINTHLLTIQNQRRVIEIKSAEKLASKLDASFEAYRAGFHSVNQNLNNNSWDTAHRAGLVAVRALGATE